MRFPSLGSIMYIHPPIYPPTHPSIHLPINLSIYPSLHLSMHPFIFESKSKVQLFLPLQHLWSSSSLLVDLLACCWTLSRGLRPVILSPRRLEEVWRTAVGWLIGWLAGTGSGGRGNGLTLVHEGRGRHKQHSAQPVWLLLAPKTLRLFCLVFLLLL